MTGARRRLAAYTLPLLLLAGVVGGSVVGAVAGREAIALAPLGRLFLNLMFSLVVPLVFCSIAAAIAAGDGARRLGRIAGRMLAVFAVTGVVGAVVALVVVVAAQPTAGLEVTLDGAAPAATPSALEQVVAALTVPDFVELLSRRNVLPLIVFAALVGIAAASLGERGRPVARGLALVNDVLLRVVAIVMWAAPIGLGAYFAAIVGEHGGDLLGDYLEVTAIYYVVSLGYFAAAFSVYAWLADRQGGVRAFWRAIPTPALTAFASGSSVATIPANLEASRQIGVPEEVRDLVVPVGATIHMDGSCISAVFKIALLAGITGQALDTPAELGYALVVALLSGVVMSGIPGGGLIGEALIVSLYGFPPEALPLLAVFGTLVDPPATMVNSTGDTIAGMLVARWLHGPRWRHRADPRGP